MSGLHLSVLDQSPIVAGTSPAGAVAATIALAKEVEALGYRRYWLAEHHAMGGLADAAPEVLLARLTAETARIRLGTGGIMLPHYSALKVAEQFRMLEALAPGRIDLGVGRAPGGTGLVSMALESRDPAQFPGQVQQLRGFLDGSLEPADPFARLVAQPSGATAPAVWMLGSSSYGALLAAELGLPYAFAHFIGGDAPHITRAYRERFRPSATCSSPRVIVALTAIAAPTDAEAEELTWPVALWRMRLFRGTSAPVPSLEEARAYPWQPREREEVMATRRVIAGSPQRVREGIEALAAAHGADEAMIVTILPDYALRARSYALVADAFALRDAA